MSNKIDLEKIRRGYNAAIHTLRGWHYMHSRAMDDDLAWRCYQQSPEMRKINSGLKKLNELIEKFNKEDKNADRLHSTNK